MRVKLRRTWFYPVDAKPVNDRRDISGGRLRKGIHEIDNALRDKLPKDAEILDEKLREDEMVLAAPDEALSAHDERRAEVTVLNTMTDEYNAQVEKEEAARQERIKEKKRAALAKARAAKAAKAEAEKAE